jgi:hypothetical protein
MLGQNSTKTAKTLAKARRLEFSEHQIFEKLDSRPADRDLLPADEGPPTALADVLKQAHGFKLHEP